tara:strand:+ start:1498 stop:1662 length:165 start_codon:yes stop_codon:yes gene_type:complete
MRKKKPGNKKKQRRKQLQMLKQRRLGRVKLKLELKKRQVPKSKMLRVMNNRKKS